MLILRYVSREIDLIINPWSLISCSKAQLSQIIQRVIPLGQPNKLSRTNNVCRYATISAFFANMSMAKI